MRYADIPLLATWQGDTFALRKPTASPQLRALDADIELYNNAYSPMAKQNLIYDLNRKFRAWEQANIAQARNFASVALRDVIARKLRERQTDHAYTHVICIGWAVPCSTNTGQYYRTSPHDRLDMENKCREMKLAINAAQTHFPGAIADDRNTLKIFMAPEFYFRGKNGAYAPDIVADIIPNMMKDKNGLKGTGHNDFADWLFVFGTAVSAMETQATRCQTCGTTSVNFVKQTNGTTRAQCRNDPTHPILRGTYGAETHNVALIQKGRKRHLITKEYTSGIDYKGVQPGAPRGIVRMHPGKPDEKLLNVLPPAGSRESDIDAKFDDERMGGSVFNVDGITFGLEICLDHIASATPNQGRLAHYSESIQIHLIPSYGMTIGDKMYCKTNGIVFNVDGRPARPAEVKVKNLGPQIGVPVNPGTRGNLQFFGPFQIPL